MSRIDHIRRRLHHFGIHRFCHVSYEQHREFIVTLDGSVDDVSVQGHVMAVHR